MIHHHSVKEERNFKEEYQNAYQDYVQAEQDYIESKKSKKKQILKAILVGVLFFFVYLFFRMGGVILDQKVQIEDGYVFYLDHDLLSYTVHKTYKKVYVPFILKKQGSDIIYYSNQYFNELPKYDSRKYSFDFMKYECYSKNKKVPCNILSDLEKIEKGQEEDISYQRRKVSTNSFLMTVYKGNCDFEVGKVYSGKVLTDLKDYITPGYHYCILLKKKENKNVTTEIRIPFSFIND